MVNYRSGDQLRLFRERAQLSGRGLARLAGVSQSKISKIERGNVLATSSDILQLSRALRLSGAVTERWLELVSRDHQHLSESSKLSAFHFVNDLERSAREVDTFLVNTLPALLQTPGYTAHFLGAAIAGERLQEVLRLRFERQARLFEERKTFRFLIREQAMRCFGEASEMWRHQMGALAEILRYGRQEIRVLGDGEAVRCGLIDDFFVVDGSAAYYDTLAFQTVRFPPDEERLVIDKFAQAWKVGVPLTQEYLCDLVRAGGGVDLRDAIR